MSIEPEVGYARLEGKRIAYQVIGDGPVDLLITNGYWGSFDVEWEDPMIRLFHEQVAGFARIIRFDRLGTGSSDPMPTATLPPWESFTDEIECVLDAVGSEEVALFCISDAGPAGMLFAATRPQRCKALILFNSFSGSGALTADDYPYVVDVEDFEAQVSPSMQDDWGTQGELSAQLFFASKASDPRFLKWVAKFQRGISSPEAAMRYSQVTMSADARPLLSAITVPTLVFHREAHPLWPVEHGKFLADNVEGARLVVLPGSDGFPYWEYPELTIAALEKLLAQPHQPPTRILASVLFTDIVDSTARATAVGDRKWRALLDEHDRAAADVLSSQGGRVVKNTGDGILGVVDGPGRAIRAAEELRADLGRLGLDIRCGIHTGEIEMRADDVSGLAVHIAARAMSSAGAGQIVVTGVVKDLVTGSGIGFSDLGAHTLKGVDGSWQLFAVEQ